MQKQITYIFILMCTLTVLLKMPAQANNITILKSLKLHKNQMLKQLRKDVRSTIIVIKSHKPAAKLPQLKFFKYKVQPGDTFWTILARCSMNIDTLLTLNSLSSPREVYSGKIIFIPNMRGLVIEKNKTTTLANLEKIYQVKSEYIAKINGNIHSKHKYLFIGENF